MSIFIIVDWDRKNIEKWRKNVELKPDNIFSWKKKMLDHKNPRFMDMEQIKSGREAVFPEKLFFLYYRCEGIL